MVTSNAAFAIPSMDPGAVLHRISPERTRVLPQWGGLSTVLWNHGPGMWRQIRQKNDPYPQLNAQEMADIFAFLYQASGIDRAGDASAGQRVFNEKGCVRCHSVGGTGGQTAPELSKIAAGLDSNAWTPAMLNHAGSMIAPITSTLGQWPQFTGHEMNDLIAYVSLQRSPAIDEHTGNIRQCRAGVGRVPEQMHAVPFRTRAGWQRGSGTGARA